jgi:hypothetical protein
MAKVTIEGVINSDVCARGKRYTVEMTDQLRGLLRSGIVKVVDWHHDDEPAAPARKRRRARDGE